MGEHQEMLVNKEIEDQQVNPVKYQLLVLQVRLELTASASLTVYKYGALTDCATGAADCGTVLWFEEWVGRVISRWGNTSVLADITRCVGEHKQCPLGSDI